jgi:O-antigen ligase
MGVIKPKIRDKVYSYLFLALAFFIPVHDKLVPPIILLIGLNWILEFNFKEKFNRIKDSVQRRNILSFGILYILYVIGTLYSTQLKGQEGALFDLEVKLSLLIFPLLFSTIDFSSFKKGFFGQVLVFFVAGSLSSGVVLFGLSIYDYFERGNDFTAFFYTNFSHWQHPSYLALFYAFSIAVLIVRLFPDEAISKNERYFYFLLILCFQLLIVLLSSKAGILATVVMYFVVVVYLFVKKNLAISKRFWLPLFLFVSFFLTLSIFPQSYGRFISVKHAVEHESTLQKNTNESSAARILVWKSAFEIIKSNPVIGVGTGDVKQELRKVYKKNEIEGAYEGHLNAHNQFIQTTVALGIVGLIVLALSFLMPAILSFKKNSLLYLLFLVLVSFHFLVESMLERQAGVVFYVFFNSLLFYFATGKNEPGNKNSQA